MSSAATSGPLAITMGEPSGIGTEVLLKAYEWFRQRPTAGVPFFLIDDPVRLARLVRALRAPFQIVTISEAEEALKAFNEGLPVLPLADCNLEALQHVQYGHPTTATAEAVTCSISQGVELCLDNQASGIVTLPIQKSVLQESGFEYPGHTEYLGHLTEGASMPFKAPRGPVMMLAAGNFRTVPVTVHMPLREVAERLHADRIVRTGLIVSTSLQRDFGISQPVLALCGLNPHAGEEGRLGSEEREIIAPAIEALREQGIRAIGPLPGDTMFHEEARSQFDAALAMYHDQALIPIKTVAFHEAVNITLGLPIVRTSPDHGTGLAIAGKGVARSDSTIAAILMAARMGQARAEFDAR